LKGFKRVSLGKGSKQTITFDLRPQDFEVFDEQGRNYIDSKRFEISVGISQPDDRSIALTGVQPLQTELNLAGSQTTH
jgi:beta-glucosidase